MNELQREYIAAECGVDLDDNSYTISEFDLLIQDKRMPDLNRCVDCIKNDDIKQQLFIAFDYVPKYFYKIAASSTGKYHPRYALGECGLLRHTVAAAKIACDIVNLDMFVLTDDEKDYIICALLLHDVCKSGVSDEPTKYTLHTHPLLAAELVKAHCSKEFADNVAPLIASHMGQWNTCKWDKGVLPLPVTKMQQIVHLCDYLASRKYLEVIFNYGE